MVFRYFIEIQQFNGRREVWTEYEETKAYFLELMMSTEGEDRDRAECVYIIHLRIFFILRKSDAAEVLIKKIFKLYN